jgi:enterochelin esterase-like enzyme
MDAISPTHTYREFPGDLTWDYWDEHVIEAIAQHTKVLGIATR